MRQPVTILRSDVLRAIPELRRTGMATVPASNGATHRLWLRQLLTIPLPSCPGPEEPCKEEPRLVTVRDLIATCPAVAPFPSAAPRAAQTCLLLQSKSHITVDTRLRSRVSGAAVLGALGGVVLVVGALLAIGYIVDCAEPDDGC